MNVLNTLAFEKLYIEELIYLASVFLPLATISHIFNVDKFLITTLHNKTQKSKSLVLYLMFTCTILL